MTDRMHLIIFGLHRGASTAEVLPLVAPCVDANLVVQDIPGENDQALAIVQLQGDRLLGECLRSRLHHRRWRGRRLQPWLAVLPWA